VPVTPLLPKLFPQERRRMVWTMLFDLGIPMVAAAVSLHCIEHSSWDGQLLSRHPRGRLIPGFPGVAAWTAHFHRVESLQSRDHFIASGRTPIQQPCLGSNHHRWSFIWIACRWVTSSASTIHMVDMETA